MSDRSDHLEPDALQGFLEGDIAPSRRRAVEGHLASCARCAAELEDWRLLFQELGELPVARPSAAFREAVLEGAIGGHLTEGRIQALVDNVLPAEDAPRVSAHLAACAPCRTEVSGWTTLFGLLGRLPTLFPSLGFAERVMAAFRRRSSASAAVRWIPTEVLGRLARGIVPSTSTGRIFAAGVVAAPTVGALALLGAILAHPLIAPADLVTAAGWWLSDLVSAAPGWLARTVATTPVISESGPVLLAAISSPAAAALVLTAAWVATIGAGWIFYRNVVSLPREARRHGHASI